ncbi:MAG: hypothetical protein ACYDAI_18580, partial [Trichloromonadaceae bacterium]
KTSGRMGESSERFQVGDRHIDQHLHVITASYEDLRLQRPDTSVIFYKSPFQKQNKTKNGPTESSELGRSVFHDQPEDRFHSPS